MKRIRLKKICIIVDFIKMNMNKRINVTRISILEEAIRRERDIENESSDNKNHLRHIMQKWMYVLNSECRKGPMKVLEKYEEKI